MINLFTWMFAHENFKIHVKKFLIFGFLFYTAGGVLAGTASAMPKDLVTFIVMIAGLLLLAAPSFALQGYYWCLTENVIDRRTEVLADSVYNGKVGTKESFELPEFDIKKFIWRGIASSVAIFILIIPVVSLLVLCFIGGNSAGEFWNINPLQVNGIYILLFIMIALFFPALLWNYAKRDSVLAVLNIRKAVYIIGNYPFRYLRNVILIFVLMLIVNTPISLITFAIKSLFGTGTVYLILSNIFYFLAGIYMLFVFAYLHGTITPPGEGV